MRFKRRRAIYLASNRKRLVGAGCPTCGGAADGATGLSTHPNPQPEPGNLTICLACGAFNIYTGEMLLRRATDEELRSLRDDPRLAELAEFAAGAALRWRKEHGH
jgi:hypothetical protein